MSRHQDDKKPRLTSRTGFFRNAGVVRLTEARSELADKDFRTTKRTAMLFLAGRLIVTFLIVALLGVFGLPQLTTLVVELLNIEPAMIKASGK